MLKGLECDKNNPTIDQSNHFQLLIKTTSGLIGVPELVLKGVIIKAMEEWLLKNNKTAETIHSMPIHLKLNMMKQIFNIGKKILKQMVTAPKKKQSIIVDIAFEKAFNIYMNFVIDNHI
ncbi:MAG: hypothetical protein ACW986_05960 [Promethearchaeota archaeon]|jgi:hypothetical protein